MKRTNNKFRNNNNNYNQIYSLNYKFDSSSIAGKVSGTALDLIKKYNELAKDAHSNNDYVTAEVFRQYAEHYRKIVTEINEKKNQNFKNNNQRPAENGNNDAPAASDAGSNDNLVEAAPAAPVAETAPVETLSVVPPVNKTISPALEKKSFTVIEIPSSEAQTASAPAEETAPRPKRTYRRKAAAAE